MLENESKPQESILKTGLSKLWRGFKFVASALIFPADVKIKKKLDASFNLKKMALYMAVYWVGQPLSTFLFPRAEDVLKKEGLNPAMVQELAPGANIYVRSDNFAGKMHRLFENSPLVWPIVYLSQGDRGVVGSARLVDKWWLPAFWRVDLYFDRIDRIARDDEIDTRKSSNGRYVFVPFLTVQEKKRLTTLHEIRHCNKNENRSLPSVFLQEADADYSAVCALIRITGDTTLEKRHLLDAALFDDDEDHATTLYLDAKMRRIPMPSGAEIQAANKDAQYPTNVLFLQKLDDVRGAHEYSGAVPDLSRLSPLARRRVELFKDAWDKAIVPVEKKKEPADGRAFSPNLQL